MGFIIETQHFDVIEHPSAPVLCGGEFETIDTIVDRTRAEVDYTGPSERALVHVWASDSSEVPCADWAAGCFLRQPNEVHLRSPTSLHHEVVHAAITRSDMKAFYSEGLAEALSTTLTPDNFVAFDPRPLLDKPNTDFDYRQAATFISFMFETLGPSNAFHAMLEASAGDANAAFIQWTGQSLNVIVADFMAAERVCSPVFIPCSAEPTQVNDGWMLATPLPCAGTQTLGVDGGEYITQALSISIPGVYRLEAQHAEVTVESCTPCPERLHLAFQGLDDVTSEDVMLDPGVHIITVQPTPGFRADVRLTLED